jgi:hypothetical protein
LSYCPSHYRHYHELSLLSVIGVSMSTGIALQRVLKFLEKC